MFRVILNLIALQVAYSRSFKFQLEVSFNLKLKLKFQVQDDLPSHADSDESGFKLKFTASGRATFNFKLPH